MTSPVPETPATTPGRAAYEARLAAKSARLGFQLTPDWDILSDGNRADWEAAAQAAIDWWRADRDLEPPRKPTAETDRDAYRDAYKAYTGSSQ